MSVSKVRYIKQFFPVSSYTYNTNVYTVTANSHGLFTGIPVTLTVGTSYDAFTGPATVVDADTFTVGCTKHMGNIDNYCINGYVSGQTGEKPEQTLPRGTGSDVLIQSYVYGTGGASYKIDVSLDKEHWINLGTINHATSNGNTAFIPVAPNWAYMRPNVTSIGANTNLVIMTGG